MRCTAELATVAIESDSYAPVFDGSAGRPDLAEFVFFDVLAAQEFPDWTATADEAVGLLQANRCASPNQQPSLKWWESSLLDALSFALVGPPTTSPRTDTTPSGSAEFGDLTLTYNVFELTAAPGLHRVDPRAYDVRYQDRDFRADLI